MSPPSRALPLPLRILRTILPPAARASLWRGARAAKRVRNRLAHHARRALGRKHPEYRSKTPRLPVRPGNYLPKDVAEEAPVTLVVTFGLAGDALDKVVADIAWQQTYHLAFIPLFLVDTTETLPLRRRGYLYEYVMPMADWAAFDDPERWPDYVQSRIDAVIDTWRPNRIVTVNLEAPMAGAALCAPLRPR